MKNLIKLYHTWPDKYIFWFIDALWFVCIFFRLAQFTVFLIPNVSKNSGMCSWLRVSGLLCSVQYLVTFPATVFRHSLTSDNMTQIYLYIDPLCQGHDFICILFNLWTTFLTIQVLIGLSFVYFFNSLRYFMYQYRHCTVYNGNLYNGAWCPLCPKVTASCTL